MSLQPGEETQSFGLPRANTGAMWLLAIVGFVVFITMMYSCGEQSGPPQQAEASQLSGPDWFLNKARPIALAQDVKADAPEKVEKVKQVDPWATRKLEEEFRAMRSGLRVDLGSAASKKLLDRVVGLKQPQAQRASSSLGDVQVASAAPSLSKNYLGATLQPPVSPYELKAGTILPAILDTGINSELQGMAVGHVSNNVFDTVRGEHLLIPQGTRLIGSYDANILRGQSRALVRWDRLIFPNGHSLDIGGMQGSDRSGYSGFKDKVDNHYGAIYGNAVLLSLISAGTQLSQPRQGDLSAFGVPTIAETTAAALGQNLGQVSTEFVRRGLDVRPTLQIRPGYQFQVMVAKDIVLPGAYSDSG